MSSLGLSIAWIAIQVSVLCGLTIPIYFAVRRRNPLAGATAALSALLLSVVLTVVGFIPWPHSLLDSSATGGESSVVESLAGTQQDGTTIPATTAGFTTDAITASSFERPPDPSAMDYLRFFAESFREQTVESRDAASETPVWSSWVAAAFLIGGIGSLLWYASGLMAVIRLRLRSVEIPDPEIISQLQQVSQQINVSRTIGLRECRDLSSAATIGWTRPLILLPEDWRSWSEDECQSVLAHEVAHIHHRDFPRWLLAQVGLIAHFYHPLMHWLASRLRLEQELAADALAAQITGGSTTYLNSLARLALRQSDARVAWPARTFLPGKGTLLRRVEMLKSSGFAGTSAARVRRLAAVLAIATITVLLSTIQRPGAIAAAANDAAAESATPTDPALTTTIAAAEELDLTYVPTSAWMMVGINVDQLTRNEQLKPLASVLETQIGKEQSGIALTEYQQVLALGLIDDTVSSPLRRGPQIVIITTKDAQSFEKLIPLMGADPKHNISDDGTLRTQPPTRGSAFYQPDDRTLIIGDVRSLDTLISELRVGSRTPAWKREVLAVASGHAAIAIDMRFLRAELNGQMQHMGPAAAAFSPIWMDTQAVVGQVSLGEQASVKLRATCADDSAAERVAATVSAVASLGDNMLRGMNAQLDRAPARERALLLQLSALGSDLLKSRKIASDGNAVEVTLSTDGETLPGLIAMVLPAIGDARMQAKQMQSRNNLKQIGLAMHNYHATYNRLPAAAVVGPDGKTVHSWRVALLPFLDQLALYQQYNLNEPWDSANNLRVLENMPPVFRSPGAPESNFSSYFVVVGTHTAFNGEKEGRRFRDFHDGTSNSIMTVTAKRDIPWTKPEDIPLPDEGIPELGGIEAGGFNVGLADGSVRFLPQTIAADVLRNLFTINDGIPVQWPDNDYRNSSRDRPVFPEERPIIPTEQPRIR